jgi:23S rRNA pseudouridine1911/1915/1917 synthase
MAAIGHPVVGDVRYGTPDPVLGRDRVFLHAGSLAFVHPGSGARVSFTSELAEDLTAYLESVRP